ncbi:MAG: M23 family metallopeptidase, partial [Bacteroidales bacterium]|nr:M23 family metallopeptidase [Bacteroidales bacterium]
MIFRGLLLISTLLLTSLRSDNPDKDLFISPVRIPLLLSANFAEIRADHFHSGIDIRTQGITGHEIVAAASGYVYRISVSPGGFGKALYLRHPSGYSTVYGHLDRFIPEIEEYVTEQQYQNRSFTVSLFPTTGRFVFKQGELIAYSGNTGSSGGPHLHYEIRRSDDEFPLDPLRFEFGVRDNIKPILENLVIYPLSETTTINGQNQELLLPVQGSHGNYYIRSDKPVTISGKAGFGIRSHDLLNNSWNKCGVYSIELQIDGETVYLFQMDGLSFDETRYVNSHIDYRRKMRDNIT